VDAAALVSDADAVLIDNRFPEFVTAVCRGAQVRGIPVVIDLDLATKPDDPLLALGSHVIASSEALRATTGEKDYGAGLRRLAKHLTSFLAVTDGPNGIYWLEQGAIKHLPAFKVDSMNSSKRIDAISSTDRARRRARRRRRNLPAKLRGRSTGW
jgi:sulfofructose kinase